MASTRLAAATAPEGAVENGGELRVTTATAHAMQAPAVEEGSVSEDENSGSEEYANALREQEQQLNLPSSRQQIMEIVDAKEPHEAMRLLAPDLDSLPKKKRGKYGKRKHLSEEEKQELVRRRNRENARNTRLRRKIYADHLRRVVRTLKEEQTQLEERLLLENTIAPQVSHLQHQQEQCRQAVLKFFQLRSCGHLQPQLWNEVVTPDVLLRLPMTTYRGYDPAEVAAHGRVRECVGISGVVADTASLLNLCKHLCFTRGGDSYWCEYAVTPNNVLVQDDRAMCTWRFTLAPTTVLPYEQFSPPFLQSQGMASFRFRDAKIYEAELKFDVVNIVHQINAVPDPFTLQHPLQTTASNTGLPLLDLDFLDDPFLVDSPTLDLGL